MTGEPPIAISGGIFAGKETLEAETAGGFLKLKQRLLFGQAAFCYTDSVMTNSSKIQRYVMKNHRRNRRILKCLTQEK